MPDSRMTMPRNSEKISGAATGSRNDNNTHNTVATVIFSSDVYCF
jgi:hypothetical protein